MFANRAAGVLRASALEAAFDETLWPGLIEPIFADFAATGALFGIVDRRAGAMVRATVAGFEVDFDRVWDEYGAGIGAHDTQVRVVMGGTGARVFADGDHVDMGDARTAEYIAWQESRLGSRHHLSFVSDLSSSLAVGLSFHRTRAAGHAELHARERMARLQQILAPAFTLALVHGDALTDAYWDGAVRGEGAIAAMLDERGRVIRMTPEFEAQLGDEAPLSVRANRLHANMASAAPALEAAIAAAADQRRAAPGAVMLERQGGRRMLLKVFPLSLGQRFLASHRAAAIVFIADPDRPATAQSALQQAFGLTPRETHIAASLTMGQELNDIAAELAISRETARVHLRNIFAKTGTNRQSALVRLVSIME